MAAFPHAYQFKNILRQVALMAGTGLAGQWLQAGEAVARTAPHWPRHALRLPVPLDPTALATLSQLIDQQAVTGRRRQICWRWSPSSAWASPPSPFWQRAPTLAAAGSIPARPARPACVRLPSRASTPPHAADGQRVPPGSARCAPATAAPA